MKKHPVFLFVLLLGGSIAFAQVTPATGAGTWGVFAETSGVAVNALGAKYFLNDDLALGSGLSFSQTDDPALPAFTSETTFAVTPFLQYHFLNKGPFSLYAGGFAGLDIDRFSDPPTDTVRTITAFLLGGMVGLDWFIVSNVSLGVRYRAYYELDKDSIRTGGTTTSTSGNSINLEEFPRFILTFHLR